MANLQQTGGGGGGTTLTGTGIARNTGACTELSGDVSTSGSNVTAVKTDLVLPGNPTTTTQTQANNSTRVATTAYVDTGLGTKQATLTGTGLARNTGASTELSGDVTTSGSNAATVVKVNGAAVPVSKTVVGTNGSGQIVDATAVINTATVTCSSAELLAINTTPKTVLAAPGVGLGYVLYFVMYNYISGGTGYTTGPSLSLKNGATNLHGVLTLGNLGMTGTTNAFSNVAGSTTAGTSSTVKNASMIFSASANLTTGNGTLTITVFYGITSVT